MLCCLGKLREAWVEHPPARQGRRRDWHCPGRSGRCGRIDWKRYLRRWEFLLFICLVVVIAYNSHAGVRTF